MVELSRITIIVGEADKRRKFVWSVGYFVFLLYNRADKTLVNFKALIVNIVIRPVYYQIKYCLKSERGKPPQKCEKTVLFFGR